MASIINAPKDRTADYDYIAFSFNGKHSFEDFGIYRTSDSNSGYNETLTRTMTDKTAEVPGMDGQYYFGTQQKNKTFTVKFAFDCPCKLQPLLRSQVSDGFCAKQFMAYFVAVLSEFLQWY